MLEFKHPTMTTSLSALDFFRASTRPRSSSLDSQRSGSIESIKSSPRNTHPKSIEAACILPTVIFLGTEMFTPAEKETKGSVEVPEIVITADGDDEKAAELPAS